MNRGMQNFPFPTGKNPVSPAAAAPGLTTVAGSGAMKSSIVLFDTAPGTRTFTVPAGVTKIRAAVVGCPGWGGSTASGAGGGYSEDYYNVTPGQTFSYTVGARANTGSPNGGTCSFGGLISATGGIGNTVGGAGGTGSGGRVNTSGGAGGSGTVLGGASSGHRFGNGQTSILQAGAGWVAPGSSVAGGPGGVDGWGLGLAPGLGGSVTAINTTGPVLYSTNGGYGAGAGPGSCAGMGGGGSGATANITGTDGGIGGGSGYVGAAASNTAAPGVVIVEVIG